MNLVGIINFDSKSIVTNGKKKFYPFTSFDKKTHLLVASQKKTNTAHWAIVNPLNSEKATIVEILGPVHQFEIESKALLRHYQVLPRKYPKSPETSLPDSNLPDSNLPDSNLIDLTHLDTFSVDSESTLDIDDCISVTQTPKQVIIGIYIAMVGGYFSPTSELGKHVLKHCSSVYTSKNEYPLLHKNLSHRDFSLIPNCKRKVVALRIYLENNIVVKKEHCYAEIINKEKTSYQKFDQEISDRKNILVKYTGKESSQDIIAELMIQYNAYFGKITQLIRIQEEDQPAEYILNDKKNTLHFSLGINCYTHATSPIRRVADIITQWELIYGSSFLKSIDLDYINNHCNRIKYCHRDSSLLDLVYLTKSGNIIETNIKILERQPDSFKAEMKIGSSNIRVWFPITNSVLSELDNIDSTVDEFIGTVHGYHSKGFPKLRLKFISKKCS